MNKNVILHLSLISGIGPATIKIIVENSISSDLVKIYKFSISDLVGIGLSFDRATKIVEGLKDRSLLDKELQLLEKHQISWCTLGSPEYSQLLSNIEQPPAVIYYQGANLFASDKAIAFVGSRKADAYARVVVEKLVPTLVAQDWVIVSGGAAGVDSFVHDSTVRSGGKTIVVLGSGLLHWYPHSNTKLFNQVIHAGGMIVSCFPLQTQPIPSNFPARNRIIAGLSQGTVVVQAAAKSGALITADFALEQGRQVFAVPGSIEHGLHDGCHNLIQQGAKLVTNVQDIIIEFGYGTGEKKILNDIQENIFTQEKLLAEPTDQADRAILDRLLVSRSTEDLLLQLDLSLEDLMEKLFDLSLQGKISQDIMGLWKRI
ncbi:DNA-processing protein DprA [Candidatus Babeliales bacterium]|nr:DNA-processing protein DprA [Candidatus Babeliales bacterium]MBP9843861.1 DNA-processing protein DprA [Candidatus Babeliales bacterium]